MGHSQNGGSTKTHGEKAEPARAWLVPEQVERLRRFAGKGRYTDMNVRDRVAVSLMADTGIRVGELVALDLSNLRLEASPPELYLQPGIQKGESPPPAYLDLSESTAAELEDYLERRPWKTDALFPSRQTSRATDESIRRAVKAASRRAGISPYMGGVGSQGVGRGEPDDVTPHVLRHSVAYRMIRDEGARMVDVQLRLRHADLSTTTRIYGHLRRR